MEPARIAAILPRFEPRGLRPNHRGAAARYTILAFDTETVQGYPYTLQVYDGSQAHLWYLRPEQFLPRLVKWIRPYTRGKRRQVVLFGHVLAYDLPAILYPHARKFGKGQFEVRCGDATLAVFYGKIPFAKLYFGADRRCVVWIIDTFAYTWKGLKASAHLFGLPFPKLPHPRGLGKRVLRDRRFERYAIRDVVLTWLLGGKLLEWHRRYDVRLCVSAAQFAGRVFVHRFLHHPIPRAPEEVEHAALLSYHGGKNGFYTQPKWITCREYDLRSAYPWAMAQMPSLARGRWRKVPYVHPRAEGFYRITGRARADRYPALYGHDFRPLRGEVAGVWITSFELREALRTSELELRDVEGYIWEPTSTDHPLREFVRYFYRKKKTARTEEARAFYKLVLNSTYGKFIQLTRDDDGFERPGALFYPVLASWITGAVRAKIHRIEHEARALHTATDAIHTQKRLRTRKRLGDLEEVIHGPALLLRNKVYFHYAQDGSELKYALHGIRLKAPAFWRMLQQGKRRYSVTHLMRPREAARLGVRPLQPVKRPYTVALPALALYPEPDAARKYWEEVKHG